MLVIAFLIEGQFHIHRAGCDCPEALVEHGRSRPFVAECYEDVARHCYRQFLDDDMHMGEALDCLAFAGCTSGLTYEALMALSMRQAVRYLAVAPAELPPDYPRRVRRSACGKRLDVRIRAFRRKPGMPADTFIAWL